MHQSHPAIPPLQGLGSRTASARPEDEPPARKTGISLLAPCCLNLRLALSVAISSAAHGQRDLRVDLPPESRLRRISAHRERAPRLLADITLAHVPVHIRIYRWLDGFDVGPKSTNPPFDVCWHLSAARLKRVVDRLQRCSPQQIKRPA